MTVSDKIKHNSPFEINIYLEGAFWVAYEQSAYWFHLTRGYKPTKKLVKCLGQEVVSVGFPKSALANAGVENFRPLSENANVQSFILETVIDLEKFREWKDALVVDCRDVSRYVSTGVSRPVSTAALAVSENSVFDQIRRFDLSHAMPNECVVFISELKKSV